MPKLNIIGANNPLPTIRLPIIDISKMLQPTLPFTTLEDEEDEDDDYDTITRKYIDEIMFPFKEAVKPLTTIDKLKEWFRQLDPVNFNDRPFEELDEDDQEDLNLQYEDIFADCFYKIIDINVAKERLIDTLLGIFMKDSDCQLSHISPWTLADWRDSCPDNVRVFGTEAGKDRYNNRLILNRNNEPTITFPITVQINDNTFIENFTEDYTWGLVCALNSSWIKIFMFDLELKFKDLPKYYSKRPYCNPYDSKSYYTGNINGIRVYFSTEDFIKGTITAGKWTNKDPHDLLTKIMKVSIAEGVETLTAHNF